MSGPGVQSRLVGDRLVISVPVATSRSLEVLLGEATAARIRLGRSFETSVLDVADACRLHVRRAVLCQVPQGELALDRGAEEGALWVSTATAAVELGITTRAVRKRVAAGTLPARRAADRWLVRLSA